MRTRFPILIVTLAVVALIAGACGSANAGQVVFTGTIENRPPTCTTSEPIVLEVAHGDDEADHDDAEAVHDDAEMDMDHDDDEAAHEEEPADHDDEEVADHDDEGVAPHDHADEAEEPAEHDDAEAADHDDGEADHDDAEAAHDDDEAAHDDDEAMGHDDAEAPDHDDGTAFGTDDVAMVIEIDMTEFAYGCTPSIPSGVVVALRFTNTGTIDHEAVVGDQAAQDDAEVAMLAMQDDGDMAHGHAAPSLMVEPGETGQLIVVFDEPSELIVGCHIPGHWDAGMHTELRVSQA